MTLMKFLPLAGLLAVAAVSPPAQSMWSRNAWSAILTRYGTGDYDGAVRAIEGIETSAFTTALTPDTPENALTNWERAAPAWTRLGASPAIVRRRQLVSATVALEIVRAHPELRPVQRMAVVASACRLVRNHPDHGEAERL